MRRKLTLRLLLLLPIIFFSALPLLAQDAPIAPVATIVDESAPVVPTQGDEAILAAKTPEEIVAAIPWTQNNDFKSPGDARAIKGGEIVWPITGYPATLRVYGPNANSVFNTLMEGMCYESLLSMHPVTLEWMPALANKWYKMKDNRTFFYSIDPDAKWADGKPVTAGDVVESWRFITNPAIKSPFYNNYYKSIDEPVAITDRVVKMVSSDDSWRAFMKPSGMVIFPTHMIKDKAETYIEDYQFKFMIGSGPYEFKSTVKGREIIFERRKDYWGVNKKANIGLNNFDVFKFIVISDESLMFEKFKKGDLDWYYVNVARRWKKEIIPEKLDKLEKGWIQKRKIFTNKPAGISGLAFNMRVKPFDDIRVRRAFAYMFNREILIEKLFFNEYLPIHSYFPGGMYENEENERVAYDPDKAVKLLQEAGYDWDRKTGQLKDKNGKPLEISLMYASKSSERIWTVVQDYMADVGINFKLKLVTHETQWKLVNDRKFKIFNAAWSSPLFPNPRGTWHTESDKPNTTNVCGVRDEKIDALIQQYDDEHDINTRIEILKEMDTRLMEIQPYALGWYGPFNRILYWNKFGHPDHYLGRFTDYRSIASYWWIDPEKEASLKNAMDNNTNLPVGETQVLYWQDYQKNLKK